MKKWKDHAAFDHGSYNCELQESVAYVAAAHNKLWSEACSEEEEEEEGEQGCKVEKNIINGEDMALKPASPNLPSRQYLKEKEVECRHL